LNNKTPRYIISILCIALIALSIYYNPDVIRVRTYEEITANEPPSFTGIIKIWQVSSWRVGQSSKTLVLLDVAQEFEKKHKMLYIEVEILSYEDYIRKTSQGIYPDVLSFPAEMKLDFDKCTDIIITSALDGIYQKSYEASHYKTIPWLATSSVVLVNSKYASKENCNTEKQQSNIQIAESMDKLSTSSDYVYGSPTAMIPLAISEVALETKPLPMSEYSSWLAFARKESRIIYGCVWQTYAMDRLISKEKGFSTEYVYPHVDSPVFFWTQNFCVLSNDIEKNRMIFEYFDLVLSDKWQTKIAESTVSFSVTDVDMSYTGVLSEIDKNANSKVAIIPGLGITDDEIIKALSGDEHAKLLLKEKLVFY